MYGITIATAHLILLMGYDERYAKASPGHLLLHEIIRWALASQLQELDFLSGASHYRQWHPAQRSMHHIATADGSLKRLAPPPCQSPAEPIPIRQNVMPTTHGRPELDKPR